MKLTRVGVDLAKNIFQLHGVDRAEHPVWCKRLKRNRWIKEIEQLRLNREYTDSSDAHWLASVCAVSLLVQVFFG
jgi:transposase